MIRDVALIGIGIVGQVALEELSDCNFDIVVIDEINTTSELQFLRDIDGNKSVWTRGSRMAGFPGGRLNWGKNCSFVTIENHPPLGDEFQLQLPKLSRRLRKYGFPKLSLVELRKQREDRFYVRESTEFSATNWITKVKSSEKIQIISGLATEISQQRCGLVKIMVRKTDRSTTEIQARKVIICAGPFGTQELLANSGFLSEISPHIWDHISFALPNIQLRKLYLAKIGLFGWNRIRRINVKRCSSFYDQLNNILWTLRIFPEGVLSLEMSLARLRSDVRKGDYGSCMSLIPRLVCSLFTGKFLYEGIKVHISADFLDESNSIKSGSYGEGTRIDFLEYESKSIPISKAFDQFISRTIENLHLDLKGDLELKLSEEIEFVEITSSSHHMGTVWKNCGDTDLSPVEISRNIFAAGSSIFQATVPGHPTMLAAATAIVAADLIKSQLS